MKPSPRNLYPHLTFLLLLGWAGTSAVAEPARPNILLVLSDDPGIANAAVEKELKGVLQEWMILQHDFLPLPVPPGNREPPPRK